MKSSTDLWLLTPGYERIRQGISLGGKEAIMTMPSTWPAGWYAINDDPTMQRQWDGQQWSGVTRPTKRILGVVIGGHPQSAAAAVAQFHTQIQRLQAAQVAGRRGESRLAWIAAYEVVGEAYGPDSVHIWNSALTSIGFDPTLAESPVIGTIPTNAGTPFEVFEDFVSYNGHALDNSHFSSLSVFQDGQFQVTVTSMAGKRGRMRPVRQVHDLRTAAIQLSGPNGTLRADIHPDSAGQVG